MGTQMADNVVGIIDDDDGFRDSLEFMLETLGYKVASFASAAAFLFESTVRPICLIVDHHMQGMTGLELAGRLIGEGNEIPFLIMTAAPSSDILTRADQLGIARVLVKPFDEDDLVKFIRLSI
jgi:two-component system response regulator FixJ